MHVISKRKIVKFVTKYHDAEKSLLDWYRIAKCRNFKNFAELKSIFPDADLVGRRTVFNIAGNKYRLVARVNFLYSKIFILYILTHGEYNKDRWKV